MSAQRVTLGWLAYHALALASVSGVAGFVIGLAIAVAS